MIEKERLQELIEQEATIYELYNKDILQVKLEKEFFVINGGLYKSRYAFRAWWIKDLYETREDAEFIKEFGCIERTITLDLPIWEEIEKDKNFHYIRHYVINKNFSLFIEIYKFTKTISISWSGGIYKKDPRFNRNWELTKENYYEACRKAKELFLGLGE